MKQLKQLEENFEKVEKRLDAVETKLALSLFQMLKLKA
jgi:hypothetical protein